MNYAIIARGGEPQLQVFPATLTPHFATVMVDSREFIFDRDTGRQMQPAGGMELLALVAMNAVPYPYACIFKAEEVRPLAEHAAAAEQHRAAHMADPVPGLLWVRDDGVYLMSTGLPALGVTDGLGRSQVAYALDMAPDDEGSWEVARAAVGGGDFVEVIPLDEIQTTLQTGAEYLIIITTEDSYIVTQSMR